jgi:hypothetical protein
VRACRHRCYFSENALIIRSRYIRAAWTLDTISPRFGIKIALLS